MLHSFISTFLPALQWPCMGRETLYAAGYLGLCPILYDKLKSSDTFKVRAGQDRGLLQTPPCGWHVEYLQHTGSVSLKGVQLAAPVLVSAQCPWYLHLLRSPLGSRTCVQPPCLPVPRLDVRATSD